MTVKEVLDQLATVKATVKFYDAKNNEITGHQYPVCFRYDNKKAFDEAGQEMLTLKKILILWLRRKNPVLRSPIKTLFKRVVIR